MFTLCSCAQTLSKRWRAKTGLLPSAQWNRVTTWLLSSFQSWSNCTSHWLQVWNSYAEVYLLISCFMLSAISLMIRTTEKFAVVLMSAEFWFRNTLFSVDWLRSHSCRCFTVKLYAFTQRCQSSILGSLQSTTMRRQGATDSWDDGRRWTGESYITVVDR